jgi:hypothetical protein
MRTEPVAGPITGSRSAVLRRSELTRLVVCSDDEVGGLTARSALAMFAPPVYRRSRRNRLENRSASRHDRFVGSNEDGGSPANIASERSEPINTASVASEAIKQAISCCYLDVADLSAAVLLYDTCHRGSALSGRPFKLDARPW